MCNGLVVVVSIKISLFRRLAKSILILIPIFGLHFIIFAWIPYFDFFHIDLSDCFEITAGYFETFFNAFQVLFKIKFLHSKIACLINAFIFLFKGLSSFNSIMFHSRRSQS
jgi:uncharacterized membrane protein YczE